MTNPWTNPNPAAPVTGNGFAPATPMTTAQALAGIGAADTTLRFPELPPDGKFQLKVSNARARSGQYGLAYFYESEILASPTHPQLVGTTATVKINGFGNPVRQKMAVQDLKALLTLLFAPDGLTAATPMSDEQWAQCADASVNGKVDGRTFGAQTRLWSKGINSRTNQPNAKVIYTFFAA